MDDLVQQLVLYTCIQPERSDNPYSDYYFNPICCTIIIIYNFL